MLGPPAADAFEGFVPAAVAKAVALGEPKGFMDWMRTEAPSEFPSVFEPGRDERARRQIALALGRAIWNAVPLPQNGLKPLPMPDPERNSPCPCGSGVKYKRCCAGAAESVDITPDEVLPLVLDLLTEEELARLAKEDGAPWAVLEVLADRLLDEARADEAIDLLEPLLEEQHLGVRHERVLSALFDSYLAAGRMERLREVLERLLWRVRPPLSACVRLRYARALHDDGDRAGAWAAWEKARKEDPRRLDLASTEVVLLLAEDRFDEAEERAAAWVERLREGGLEDDEFPMPLLQSVAEDARSALEAMLDGDEEDDEIDGAFDPGSDEESDDDPWERQPRAGAPDAVLGRLEEPLLRGSERPLPVYETERAGAATELAVLRAPSEVRDVEREWARLWTLSKPLGADTLRDPEAGDEEAWDEEAPWLHFVETNPAAFDSLEVLDDVLQGASSYAHFKDPRFKTVQRLLVDRGTRILRHALSRGPRPLDFTALENRTALRLAVQLVDLLRDAGEATAVVELSEWLLQLDPEDNYELADALVYEYLHDGADREVVALALEVPRGGLRLAWGNVLALYRLDRLPEAVVALRAAISRFPVVFDYLVGAATDEPGDADWARGEEAFFSADDAWAYFSESQYLWQKASGVAEWLRESGRDLRLESED